MKRVAPRVVAFSRPLSFNITFSIVFVVVFACINVRDWVGSSSSVSLPLST